MNLNRDIITTDQEVDIMRIGIVACECFKEQLDHLTRNDKDIVHKEYLEFGLHLFPDDLKRTVMEKVNDLEGKVDAVLLGYGICNSLKDITNGLKVPTVRLDADDCIGAALTSSEYEKERKKCAGTLYSTPYFADKGLERIKMELKEKVPNYEELGIDMQWYLDKLFDGYSRVLFIDDGLCDQERLVILSERTATELKLRHERRMGSLEVLINGLAHTKALALANIGGDPRSQTSVDAIGGL